MANDGWMAQARSTQVRLRLPGIPWIELTLHDGQDSDRTPTTWDSKLGALIPAKIIVNQIKEFSKVNGQAVIDAYKADPKKTDSPDYT